MLYDLYSDCLTFFSHFLKYYIQVNKNSDSYLCICQFQMSLFSVFQERIVTTLFPHQPEMARNSSDRSKWYFTYHDLKNWLSLQQNRWYKNLTPTACRTLLGTLFPGLQLMSAWKSIPNPVETTEIDNYAEKW